MMHLPIIFSVLDVLITIIFVSNCIHKDHVDLEAVTLELVVKILAPSILVLKKVYRT